MSWIPRRGRGRPPHPDLLTPAEWRVLGQLRAGAPNAEIAVRRGVSIKTVRTHVSSILAKTGLPDRQALARWDGRPATASRPSDGGHPWGFVPPWLAVGTPATKVAAGAGTSVVFVAAVIAVYAFFFGSDQDLPASGRWLAPDHMAVVEGIPVRDWEWDIALSQQRVMLAAMEEQVALGDEHPGGPPFVERLQAHLDLVDRHGLDVATFAGLVVERAVEAEASRRGLFPDETEVAAFADQQRELDLAVLRGEGGENAQAWPDPLDLIQVAIDRVGSDRYWDDVVTRRSARALARMALAEELAANLQSDPPSAAQTFTPFVQYDLARAAEIEVAPEYRDRLSPARIQAYFDDTEAIEGG